jgi:hypothetical protein
VAFGSKVRTALRPFVEYKNAHPELAPALKAQADRALRYFAYEGDLKGVSLMMWAGADPRTPGPDLDERFADDPDCFTTAIRQACYGGKLDVLLKFKLEPAKRQSRRTSAGRGDFTLDRIDSAPLQAGRQPE